MRQIITLLITATALTLSACGRTDTDNKASQTAGMQNQDTMAGMQHDKDMQTMNMDTGKAHAMVQLPTIQCEMCKNKIEKGLAKIEGILSVHVDLEGKMGHINYDDTRLILKDIELAIAKLGFEANDTPADPVAYEALPECCKVHE